MSECKHKWAVTHTEHIICRICGMTIDEVSWLHLQIKEKDAEIASLKEQLIDLKAQNRDLRRDNDEWASSVFAQERTSLRAEVERLKGEVQQLCLDASPPPDPPKSIKLVSGVQGKSGGVHQPRKQASPEAAPDAVGFPPDTDITDCDLIAALRSEVERLRSKLRTAYESYEGVCFDKNAMKARAEQAEARIAKANGWINSSASLRVIVEKIEEILK